MLDLRPHEVEGAWNLRPLHIDWQRGLNSGERRLGIELGRQLSAAHGAGQRIGTLWIEAPKTVAAIRRHPVENVIADDHKFVARVDTLPLALLDERSGKWKRPLRIEAAKPVV